MALALNYASPYGGEDFTYFIIGEVHENRYHQFANVTLYGFIDHEARTNQSSYIPVTVAIPAGIWVKDATITEVYEMIKQTPAFAGAVDA